MTKTAITAAILSLLALAPLSLVNAQLFATGTLNNDGSNIENAGTIVDAINFIDPTDASVNPDVTLNGVTFTGESYNAVMSSYTLSLTNGTAGIDNGRAGGVPNTDALYSLVNDGVYNFGGAPSTVLTVNGLTIGSTYALQLDFDSSDTRSVSATDGLNTSSSITTGPNNGAGFITDSFVATGASETVSLDYASPTLPDEFSGFTLSTSTPAVPEPSTWAATAVAGFALFLFCGLRRLRSSIG